MKSKLIVSLFLLCFLWLPLNAEQTIQPEITVRDPRQPTREIDPLQITEMDVRVRVHGCIAETSLTMTFGSNYQDNLEGAFSFPLPAGATVSGYALDIHGEMIDGVAVEKEWATYAFETEVRKSIDPGLVEWSGEGIFRTRVYPIPPKGSRTITLRYVSELDVVSTSYGDEYRYTLPLRTGYTVGLLHAYIDILSEGIPVNRSQYSMEFEEREGNYIADLKLTSLKIRNDIAFGIPKSAGSHVWMDYSREQDEIYFVFQESVSGGEDAGETERDIHDLYILWDASGSSSHGNLDTGYSLIKTVLNGLEPDAVYIVPFRDTVGSVERYSAGDTNPSSIIKMIKELPRDGATNVVSALYELEELAEANKGRTGICMLFTDGICNAATVNMPKHSVPVFSFYTGPSTGLPLLEMLARDSGGDLFDLEELHEENILRRLKLASTRILDIEYDEEYISHVYWNIGDDKPGLVTVCGKLSAHSADLTVLKGVSAETKYRLNAEKTHSTGILRTYWAQTRLSRLAPLPGVNESELIEIGKNFGLVTPFTSLLVLETLDQYLQYRIRPPASWSEMRDQYDSNLKARRKVELQFILSRYSRYEDWWKKGNPDESISEYGGRILKYPRKYSYGGACFPAGTPVLTANGPRNIEVVRNGEEVWGWNTATLSWQLEKVIDTSAHFYSGDVITVYVEGEKIVATGNHPFWVVSGMALSSRPPALEVPEEERQTAAGGRWIEARHLRTGDVVLSRKRGEVKVKRLDSKQEELQVFNITVANVHTYAVRNGGIVVHNKGQTEAEGKAEPAASVEEATRGTRDGGLKQVLIKAWQPSFTYLQELERAGIDDAYAAYLDLREIWAECPSFFLDSAAWFFTNGRAALGQRIVSNVLELEYFDASTLRAAAFLLDVYGKLDLCRLIYKHLIRMQPSAPANIRDLALVEAKLGDYSSSLELLSRVITSDLWTSDRYSRKDADGHDSFSGERLDALLEYVRIHRLAQQEGVEVDDYLPDISPAENLDVDIRIVASWSLMDNNTGLLVIEPNGEAAYYNNMRTKLGGVVLPAFAFCYGPDAYHIREAEDGKYKIKLIKHIRSWWHVSGPAFVKVSIYTDFGRKDEKLTEMVIRMPVSDYAVIDTAEILWD